MVCDLDGFVGFSFECIFGVKATCQRIENFLYFISKYLDMSFFFTTIDRKLSISSKQ